MGREPNGGLSPVDSDAAEKLEGDAASSAEATTHPPHHHWEQALQEAQNWFEQRKSHSRKTPRRSSLILQRTTTGTKWWRFTLRPWDDDEYQDWWFAGTAIPLLAATIGPLANVFSIAALVTHWRMCLVQGVEEHDAHKCHWNGNPNLLVPDQMGVSFHDPGWCIKLNIASLVCGFVGNFFLLCNFTGRIRYIISLPVTIVMWYIATGILIGITASMAIYVPPIAPQQTYTEGFWYGVFAACMYMICSMLLMVNMLGYFLGHYPQHFTLTDPQRTLILQTMLFFIWLAGGAGIFSAVESRYGTDPDQNWNYVNGIYYCDVTILTVGFGDMYPTSDLGRGLVFPYAVGGIIMLGLMVSSIGKFAAQLSQENIIRKHVETSRAKTFGRTVTSSLDIQRPAIIANGRTPTISGPMEQLHTRSTGITFADQQNHHPSAPRGHVLKKVTTLITKPNHEKKPKLLLLREEKDRFEAMRHIQDNSHKFKRWYALVLSIIGFGIVWGVGAVVFWRIERDAQHMTYFDALYLGYVSLLTIGYGDFAPITNAGRAFFVLWSLIAIPTMTILVSDLGNTVINNFKTGTHLLADFTVLPKHGVWHGLAKKQGRLIRYLNDRKQRKAAERRLTAGFEVGPDQQAERGPTLEQLAREDLSHAQLAKRLMKKIRNVAADMKNTPSKRYSYEEWVEITQLIRFTSRKDWADYAADQDEMEDLIEWDWIGEDSPLMARNGEPEFVLDRLTESMHRLIRNAHHDAQSREHELHRLRDGTNDGGVVIGRKGDDGDNDNDDSESDASSFEAVDPLDVRPRSVRRRDRDSPPSSSGG